MVYDALWYMKMVCGQEIFIKPWNLLYKHFTSKVNISLHKQSVSGIVPASTRKITYFPQLLIAHSSSPPEFKSGNWGPWPRNAPVWGLRRQSWWQTLEQNESVCRRKLKMERRFTERMKETWARGGNEREKTKELPWLLLTLLSLISALMRFRCNLHFWILRDRPLSFR